MYQNLTNVHVNYVMMAVSIELAMNIIQTVKGNSQKKKNLNQNFRVQSRITRQRIKCQRINMANQQIIVESRFLRRLKMKYQQRSKMHRCRVLLHNVIIISHHRKIASKERRLILSNKYDLTYSYAVHIKDKFVFIFSFQKGNFTFLRAIPMETKTVYQAEYVEKPVKPPVLRPANTTNLAPQ